MAPGDPHSHARAGGSFVFGSTAGRRAGRVFPEDQPMNPEPLARLTLQRTDITTQPAAIAGARERLTRERAIRLPGLLAPDLLAFVQREIEASGFHTGVHEQIPGRPVDLRLNPSLASGIVLLAVNDARFLALAREITGRPEIG